MPFAEDILGQFKGHALRVSTVPKGHLRVDSFFTYTDGSTSSVFLAVHQPEDDYLCLTDFGNTLAKVAELYPDIDIPSFTAAASEKVVSSYSAHFVEDRLEVWLSKYDRSGDVFAVNASRLADVSTSVVRFAKRWRVEQRQP